LLTPHGLKVLDLQQLNSKMKWKKPAILLFIAVGLSIGIINVRNSTNLPDPVIEQSVILAGLDLPVSPEALGIKVTGSKELKISTPVVFKDEVVTAKVFIPVVIEPKIKTTDKGDNLLVLINKTTRLPSTYAPTGLVNVNSSIKVGYSGMKLRKAAADNLLKIFNDAKKKGYNLNLNSAYRSYQTQVNTYNYWVSQVGVTQANRFSAKPGHSQHQLGTTVDVTSDTVDEKLVASFGNTPEGKWLANNAYKYGFVLAYPAGYEHITGYTYEPWHFRYIGVSNAQSWKNSGLILENYLQKFGVW